MSFLNLTSALIAAGVTVPVLLSLYFLKLRRKRMLVPSTLLWKKAIQDMQVNAPFQRIRNNLLLWLQLLLLVLLLFAMARPTQRSSVSPGQRLVIVIDHSGSMNTTDGPGGQTRLEQAKAKALELIDSMDASPDVSGGGSGGTSGGAMVVSFAERAAVVQSFTNDLGLLRAAVRGIEATDQRSRIEPALGLIQPHTSPAPGSALGNSLGNAGGNTSGGGGGLSVVVLSDGRVHRAGGEALALRGAALVFERMGRDATANVGIVSCSARRDYDQPARVSVFVRLTHTGVAARRVNVTMKVDGRAVRTKAVLLPAAEASKADSAGATVLGQPGDASVTFDLTLAGGATIEIEHDQLDTLAADNTARLQLLAAQRLRVLLVTKGNRYLREAIRAAGARQLEIKTPEQYEAISPAVLRSGDGAAEGFDVVVFDRYSPEAVPSVNSLSFGAAPPVPGFAVKVSAEGSPTMQAVLTWQRDHPLMRYVVLDDVTLRRPGRLTVPASAKVLAVGLAGPLIAEVTLAPGNAPGSAPGSSFGNASAPGNVPGSSSEGLGGGDSSDGGAASLAADPTAGQRGLLPGGRHVAVSFDVLESRWPHHWSFQVFMVNALDTLGLSGEVAAGEAALSYRVGESASVPAAAGVSTVGYAGPTRLSATVRGGRASLPAFRRVGFYETDSTAVGSPYDRLAVNMLDPLESDVRPAERLEVGSGVAAATGESSLIRQEIWPWFAWGALGLLLVEWVVYTGRMRV